MIMMGSLVLSMFSVIMWLQSDYGIKQKSSFMAEEAFKYICTEIIFSENLLLIRFARSLP